LFAFWDAEEKGLLGSEHWVKHPTVPLARIKFNVNVDMIGRMQGEKLIIYGTRSAAGLRRLASEANADADLQLSFVWWINPQSDHYTFFKQKIPVYLLHTGLHGDYHRPSDDAHKINVDGMRRATQLMFRLSYKLAHRDELPAFRKQSLHESTAQRRAYESAPPALPPRLGVSWSPDDEENQADGLKLTAITRNSPAERAGLRPGDRVTEVGGEPVKSGQQLRQWIAANGGHVELQVIRPGSEKPLQLSATLPSVPPRLGIWWRENDAEPGAVMVAHVVPDSPAARAGVQRLDRVHALGGQTFANQGEFQHLATTLMPPFDMLVERNGRMISIVVGE
jgi:membrane-associated protease RseP (regulator of RpoE activity)